MSFSEMLLIGVIAIVVVGPRNLPSLMRNAGHLIGRIRRMAMDLRTESGIDEILEVEGIRSEIDNFRRLAAGQISLDDLSPNVVPDRDREYPRSGCDVYGAVSEDLVPYLPAPPQLTQGELPFPAPTPPQLPAMTAPVSGGPPAGAVEHSSPAAPTPAAPTPGTSTLPAATPASIPSNGAGMKN